MSLAVNDATDIVKFFIFLFILFCVIAFAVWFLRYMGTVKIVWDWVVGLFK